MSNPYPEQVRAEWLELTSRWQELLIVTEPTKYVTHWDKVHKRSRRCGGAGCQMCGWGVQKQLRVALMGVNGKGLDRLIEVRERHRYLFDGYASTVGLVVGIRKVGNAANSPVDVAIRGEREAAVRDITRLSEFFGLPALMMDNHQEIARQQREHMLKPQRVELEEGEKLTAAVGDGVLEAMLRPVADGAADEGGGRVFGKHLPNPPGYEDFA